MKVVREDDTDCAPHEVGELVSRMVGQEVEVEYLGKKKASEEKTRGGWLRSGDMCHADEEGWLYFDYRKGGGLRRAGDFIMPEHVESVIATHPDVTDVCVYGIPAASGAPGEVDLVAAVVAAPGRTIEAEVRLSTVHGRSRQERSPVVPPGRRCDPQDDLREEPRSSPERGIPERR